MPLATRFVKVVCLTAILIPLGATLAGGHGHTCPDCGCAICRPVETTIKEKDYCFEVECKQVCIPAIRWPWESCCEPPRCGKVKTVKVLKKVEYECAKCGYQWEIQAVDCKCGK
jgi:hypothetical protein